MLYFLYTDSLKKVHKIDFKINEYHSVMELLWDRGYEDWGDCKGRSWCGTCHVKQQAPIAETNAFDDDEILCLNKISFKLEDSRLACQIHLNLQLDKQKIHYLGCD